MITEIDKYRLLIEQLPYGFAYHQMVLDNDGRPVDYIFMAVNPAFEEMTGLIKEEIIGRKVTEVLPDIRDSEFDWIATYGKVASGEEVLDFEQYSEPLNRWYGVKAYSDEYGFFITILHDITELKYIQDDLEYQLMSQELISDISASFVNTPVTVMDFSINKALQKIGLFFDADRSYIFMISAGGTTMDNTHEWCAKGIEPQIDRMKNIPAGNMPWSSIPLVSGNKLFGFFGVDFVGAKREWTREQESLLKVLSEIIANTIAKQKSEGEKHLILNTISESVVYLDPDLRLIWANQVAADSIGKPLDEIGGQLCYQLWSNRDEPCSDCPVVRAKTTKKPETGEVITDYGRIRDLQGYPTLNKNNEVIGLVKVGTDITKRKQMESDLQESEHRFRELVEMAPDAILVQTDKRLVYVNQAGMDLFGAESFEDLQGTCLMERFHPDYREEVAQRISLLNEEKQAVPRREQIYLKLDGTPVDVEVAAVPIRYQNQDGALVYVRDITERKLLERERIKEQIILRHQQKLEAIGVLASGVAHEINNPINGIMNYAQLILDNEKNGDSAEYASEIIRETERVSTIVTNLLHFSRQEKQSHSPARIEDIIQHTLSLIRTLFRRDQIILELDVPEDLPSLKCRSQQIEQVLMNLLTNARDALNNKYPDYDEAKIISIACSLFHRDGRRWLRITIKDNGSGISEKNHEKVFEPFFTTKSRDQGTGLGLAISYGIVKDHHGEITFDTKLGEYTYFYLDLPVDNGWDIDDIDGHPEDE